MDGNGRWARQRGLSRLEGHRRGVETVREVLKAARQCGVRVTTLYAFSVENWRRPETEISGLWRLLDFFVGRYLDELIENETRLHVIGRRDGLPEGVLRQITKAEAATAHLATRQCNIALNYGARTEVLDAVRSVAKAAQAGRLDLESLDWAGFEPFLYTAGLPDPDLLIRTSGETRLSNFLLLQCAYAELYFTPVLWPDFSREHFAAAIDDYRRRERRYGLTGEQVHAGGTLADLRPV